MIPHFMDVSEKCTANLRCDGRTCRVRREAEVPEMTEVQGKIRSLLTAKPNFQNSGVPELPRSRTSGIFKLQTPPISNIKRHRFKWEWLTTRRTTISATLNAATEAPNRLKISLLRKKMGISLTTPNLLTKRHLCGGKGSVGQNDIQ
ncbi:hypothetical protein Nepgr_030374 [Nepenthes gracilis]|uniref:Uncharacterized protein n=1 Tax=Nepenthes gracilis TaxID=150966 RepID=A0AAD3Y6H8_NEPGR|nr:hypothetical protein Nepgr_030374 [Nepenthes gracilis]